MDETKYNRLEKWEQAVFAWGGKHLSTRIDREHYILLLMVEEFYVEMYYNLDYQTVTKFRAISDLEELNPFLEQLNLDGFL